MTRRNDSPEDGDQSCQNTYKEPKMTRSEQMQLANSIALMAIMSVVGVRVSAQEGNSKQLLNAGDTDQIVGSTALSEPAPVTEPIAKKVHQALQQPVDFEFIDTPLADVARQLSERIGVPVVLDPSSLKDGFGGVLPVNLVVSGITLRSALNLMLRPHDLDYVITDEVVQITSRERAESLHSTVVIAIPPSLDELPAELVADIIRACVRPGTWPSPHTPAGKRGGPLQVTPTVSSSPVYSHRDAPSVTAQYEPKPGTIETLGRLLVISQSREALRNIHEVLHELDQSVRRKTGSAELAIHKSLASPIAVDFVDTDLRSIMEWIAVHHRINIVVDEGRLRKSGIELDSPINLTVSQVSLAGVLDLILVPLGADYIVEDEVLMITSRSAADLAVGPRLYAIEDLAPGYSSDAIAQVLMRSLEPDSWMADSSNPSVTAVGAIEALPNSLFVTHSQRMHRRVEALLDQIRAARKAAETERPEDPLKPGDAGGLQPSQPIVPMRR
jgi:hypothetical protein